jgi:hypothetical protein
MTTTTTIIIAATMEMMLWILLFSIKTDVPQIYTRRLIKRTSASNFILKPYDL